MMQNYKNFLGFKPLFWNMILKLKEYGKQKLDRVSRNLNAIQLDFIVLQTCFNICIVPYLKIANS